MKVAVVGGTGVFGSRLARLLVRDGHDVWLAGRQQARLTVLARDIGAQFLVMDRAVDLAPLLAIKPDAIVDAAGPFHAYGADPYRLARAAIGQGIHYLDLADDAEFCAGLIALDAAAKAAGTFALSGASSVPGLSSIVVAGLTHDAQGIDTIASAILPGNRAPRGQSVVESILHQAGSPIRQTIAGQEQPIQSWSDRQVFDLSPKYQRAGYVIRVPDQVLFPACFGARTVTFHAGLELEVMNRGLAALAKLRAWTGLRVPDRLILWGAWLMSRLGSEVGGMAVDVTWRGDDGWQRSAWRLIVRDGQGPFIPAVVARAILRQADQIAPGARPALAEVSLKAVTDAMSDLAVETTQTTTPVKPLFPSVLSDSFANLPADVQTSHQVVGPLRLSGQASVTRGTSLWARLIAKMFGFPPAAAAVPVEVLKTPQEGCERWTRTFGDRVFQSTLRQTPRGMSETFGPLTFDLDLHVAADALHFPVLRGRCLGIPLPRWMLPRSEAQETADDQGFCFDVALYAPITGDLIVHYRGRLS